MMPRLDGFEMVRRIRKTDNRPPVLFLTAKSTPDDVVTGFELGANDYLKKPFAIQELIVRIKALMGKAYMTERREPEQNEIRLRRHLAQDPHIRIINVRGTGYKLIVE